ncbi:MAG TPA: bacillithiol biosynthesis cysteine-adding enzyme BshC [Trueperaceae bacterium]|nr:bacillithiol biosynthesis cysteine-adding enzyme BshC [Trueperaceae bacterium]
MPEGESPPSSSSFLERYRAGELSDFFELAAGDVDAGLALPRQVDRRRLAGVMRRHARRLGAPDAVFRTLERLEHPASRAVVTGQQTGLLLGPVYTLSKAVTAVRLAQRLDREDRPVVPVFWLASQDHDTDEVDHAYLLDGEERLHRLAVPLPVEVGVGRAPVTSAMVRSVEEGLRALDPEPPFLGGTLALVKDAAGSAESFADWFAFLLYRLLGDAGLALFDPMQADAAELLRPVLERELASPEATVAEVNDAGRRLKRLGFTPQLGRGAEATNLFLETEDEDPPRRVLLRHEGRNFRLEGRALSGAEVTARLDADPAALTPAAGLRPVVQDAVLPTAVVVLGPGELRYFAQLRGVYRHHGVAMPLVWPRATATVLEPPAARILDKYGLDVAGFQADPDGCLERVVLERSGHGERFRTVSDELEVMVRRLLREVAEIDPTLQGTVARGHGYLDTTLQRLRDKTAAALEREDAITRRQFDRLRSHLLPLGQPAERVLSPFSFVLKFGVEPVVRAFLSLGPEGDFELRI